MPTSQNAQERSSEPGYFEDDLSLDKRPRQARLSDGSSAEDNTYHFYPSQQNTKREVKSQSSKSQNINAEAASEADEVNRPDRDRKY